MAKGLRFLSLLHRIQTWQDSQNSEAQQALTLLADTALSRQ